MLSSSPAHQIRRIASSGTVEWHSPQDFYSVRNGWSADSNPSSKAGYKRAQQQRRTWIVRVSLILVEPSPSFFHRYWFRMVPPVPKTLYTNTNHKQKIIYVIIDFMFHIMIVMFYMSHSELDNNNWHHQQQTIYIYRNYSLVYLSGFSRNLRMWWSSQIINSQPKSYIFVRIFFPKIRSELVQSGRIIYELFYRNCPSADSFLGWYLNDRAI